MEFCAVCSVQLFSDHDQTSLINISKGQTLCDRKIHQCCFIAHGACNHHGGSGWRGRGVLMKGLILFAKNNFDTQVARLHLIRIQILHVKQMQGWRLWVSVNTCSYQAADSTLQQLQSVVHRLGSLLRHAENFHWNCEVFHRLFWNFCLSW